MNPRRALGLFASVCSLPWIAALACSPAATPPPDTHVTPTASATTAAKPPGPESPARYVLEPYDKWSPLAKLDLGGGAELLVGRGGERWLNTPTGAKVAEWLLPRDVAGAMHDGAGYTFVATDGSVYSANDPLGALTKVSAPRTPATAVAAGKSAILLVDENGAMTRSADHGKTFAKVTLPGADGVVWQVAMSGGVGLALCAPQRVLVTKDDGASWAQVPTPGDGGVRSVAVADGALVLGVADARFKLDPTSLTFSAVSTPGKPQSGADVEGVVRVVEGKRALVVRGRPFSEKREWSVAAGDMTAMPDARVVEELTGCDLVSAAMRGDVIELACDARGTVEAGVDKTASPFDRYSLTWPNAKGGRVRPTKVPFPSPPPPPTSGDAGTQGSGAIVKLLRSEDFGKTFKDDGTVDRIGDSPTKFRTMSSADPAQGASVAVGDGGWVALGRRCLGPSWDRTCGALRVRASATAAFAEQSADPATYLRFASGAKTADVYAIGSNEDGVHLYRWKAGATAPEIVTDLASGIKDEGSTSLSVDDDGTVRGFFRGDHGPHAFEVKAETSELTVLDVPASGVTHMAFGGTSVLALGSGVAWESVDRGKTWSPITVPYATPEIAGCSREGCALPRGFRIGWDSGSPIATKPDPEPATTFAYAKPLKCTARGSWTRLGGGGLPSVDAIDVGGNRWVLPTRDEAGRVTVHVNKRTDPVSKTSDVPLLGPALGAPKWGSETLMFVQPRGVVVRRYTYSRERRSPGVYNPVDAQLAWYRADTGKTFRATVPKLPAFRVNHDPHYSYDGEVSATPAPPEVLSLDQKGLYFVSMSYGDGETSTDLEQKHVYFLRDDGKIDKRTHRPQDGIDGAVASVQSELGVVTFDGDKLMASWAGRDKRSLWAGGTGVQFAGVIDFGGRPAAIESATDLLSPKAWAVPLKMDNDPSEWFAVPTQKSLGDVPRACDPSAPVDATAFRFDAPYSYGTRHPVKVDVDGADVTLATGRFAVRGSTKSPADGCVSGIEATSTGAGGSTTFEALIFPDDLAHAMLFSVDESAPWPMPVTARAMECAYVDAPLPEALRRESAFYAGKRPSESNDDAPSPRGPFRK